MESSPGYLKNPRILTSAAIALLAILLAFVVSREPENGEGTASELLVDAPREKIDADLDGDGLSLWEEELWGTSPTDPDSDADGTPDKEEVRLGRNPAKPGPDDKDGAGIGAVAPKSYYDDDPLLSTTDVVSRDVLSAFLAMKQSGTYDEKELESLAAQMLSKTYQRTPTIAPIFSPNDVRIAGASDPESYRAYANALGTIFSRFRDDGKESEIAIFSRAVEKSDESLLEPLGSIASSYLEIGGLIIALPVPKDLAAAHLDLANAYSLLSQSLTRMRSFFQDPLAHVEALRVYSDAITQMEDSFLSIRRRVLEKGVTFIPLDPGAPYFGSITQ